MSPRSFVVNTLIAVFLLLPGAETARAAVAVFGDFNGNQINDDGSPVYGQVPKTFDLYVEAGTVHASNPCRTTSTGDDICGYHVRIQVDGAGYITSFTPAAGIKFYPLAFGPGIRNLTVAFVGGYNPGPTSAAPLRIGTLNVNGQPSGGTRVLVTGQALVDAGLQSRIVPSRTLVTLPEPESIAQLVSGSLLLALLHRSRRARAG